jgi:hypothetical protein
VRLPGLLAFQTAEQLAEGKHDAGVDDAQQDGEGPIDQVRLMIRSMS